MKGEPPQAQRRKRKGGKSGLPKPLRRRGCAWRDKVWNEDLVLSSTTELVVSHVWKGLFLRDEQLKGEEVAVFDGGRKE